MELFWIECIADDEDRVDKYIRLSKVHNDDYKGKNISEEEAFVDFKKRIG